MKLTEANKLSTSNEFSVLTDHASHLEVKAHFKYEDYGTKSTDNFIPQGIKL